MNQITEIERDSRWTTFSVAGTLTLADCILLRARLRTLTEEGKWVRLDCSELRYMDPVGAAMLGSLNRQRLQFVGWRPCLVPLVGNATG